MTDEQAERAAAEIPDLAQEVLSRVWASRARVTPEGVETYAIRVVSNLLLSQARQRELHTRHQPRLYDPTAGRSLKGRRNRSIPIPLRARP